MERMHFLNGQLVTEDKLLISARDLGYSRGYAVFEFMMTYHGRLFLMERYIDRLFRSCESISFSLPWSKEQISDWVLQTLKANEPLEDNMVVRITVSGGLSETLFPAEIPTITIVVDPRFSRPTAEYTDGVRALLHEFERYEPQAKTNNYIEAVRQFRSSPAGIDEIIYHSGGMVREGTRSNVFAVFDGSLVTPKIGVLEGITRDVILNDLSLSIPVKARDISVEELLNASEVFITATAKEIMPITQLNDVAVGDGRVGPVTKEVMAQFRDFTNSDRW